MKIKFLSNQNLFKILIFVYGTTFAFLLGLEFGDVTINFSIEKEIQSAVIRNYVLVLLAFPTVALGIWRLLISDRQVKAAETGLGLDRYQKAIEFLSHDKNSVRTAGIHSLNALLSVDERFAKEVASVLREFLAEQGALKNKCDAVEICNDQQFEQFKNRAETYKSVIDAFHCFTNIKNLRHEQFWHYEILSGLNLRGARPLHLKGLSISNSDLSDCEIIIDEDTVLQSCDLTRSIIVCPKMPDKLKFYDCHVSNLRIQCPDDFVPVVLGWHLKNYPILLADYWGMPNLSWREMYFEDSCRQLDYDEVKEFFAERDFALKSKVSSMDWSSPDPNFTVKNHGILKSFDSTNK